MPTTDKPFQICPQCGNETKFPETENGWLSLCDNCLWKETLMEEPKFPEEFIRNHCSKVLEARHWRKLYEVEGTAEDDMNFAECAFNGAGGGLECENCGCSVGVGSSKKNDKFLEPIRQFYKDTEKYETQKKEEIDEENEEEKEGAIYLLIYESSHPDDKAENIDGVFSTYKKAEKVKKAFEKDCPRPMARLAQGTWKIEEHQLDYLEDKV